ncbi:DUF2283 domain-containing protein [Corynebacterium pseudodiphtheriticum]|uniref:DUF2283 domain-containing protein n=1 Tax=Corynebacterium pseudodiphtheriticum TaxID=37637 RepID=A0ABT7FWA5_9CORY|nr:DUF2283 domain-containing protein [Corynebacterium pseudodiphtheriticum]MDK4206814.1 DUF2283 domain-containing protein [Corynebacterium pseudodiphtheriticum]MDK4284977.1 DUF2283 domain-containing protein [Corynebacterium pseudodiphtheriticum]MDK4289891.1 DUF2283 domain-containing protein [Corynebacterium pseudodiphtheriticum]MDK4327907.1 DUF2283 domain-containing protein [Corynebacterium pseudodiphtheriticum]MDK8614723.1 DUF2283 domain-containing protein [Corynebacterium pseudodiphtheriticu
MQIQVTRSRDMEAGYIELAERAVSHSEELDDGIIVDLDEFDCVVGLELLSLQNIPPIKKIDSRFHVKDTEQDMLRLALRHLMRMTATSGSLTSKSQIKAAAIDGRELEAC